MNTNEMERLRAFRHQVYTRLQRRRDAQFEIIDAVLTTPVIESPAHLSLAPAFPPNTPTGGRPKRHGATFVCEAPLTWWEPPREWADDDAGYGHVRLRACSGVHAIPATHGKHVTPQAKPIVKGWLILLEVERLPKPTKVPDPLWLWWWGKEPPTLEEVWRVYISRFAIEHTFRFFKQVLKWTVPKLRSPAAADRWTWLLVVAYVQLRLAQPLVADHHLPWHRPLPVERLTPARVRRSFSDLLAHLGSPVTVPKACGRSPGRSKGKRSEPAKRIPAVK